MKTNKVTIKCSYPPENGVVFPFEMTLEAELYKDGNRWCCLIGEDIQDGMAGFGDSPADAIQNCAENAKILF